MGSTTAAATTTALTASLTSLMPRFCRRKRLGEVANVALYAEGGQVKGDHVVTILVLEALAEVDRIKGARLTFAAELIGKLAYHTTPEGLEALRWLRSRGQTPDRNLTIESG